jgi:hypothetical protein
MTGIERIAAERKRQMEEEGFTAEDDNWWIDDQLATAAACYAVPKIERDLYLIDRFWPWNEARYKPTPDNRIRGLEKAGALIAAEIDRLQRMEKGEK